MDDRVDAVERALARLGVADVAALEVHAERVEPGRHVVLPVQEDVEPAHLVSGGQQLVDELAPDVAGRSCDQDPHWAVPVSGWRSGRNMGRSCSNSIKAFS